MQRSVRVPAGLSPILGQRDVDFHIFSPLLAAIESQRVKVLRRWRWLYAEHFGDERTLSDSEFDALMNSSFDSLHALMGGDASAFRARVSESWRALAKRGVCFSEGMVLVRLFEESAAAILAQQMPSEPNVHSSLHDFAFWCVPIVADVYFGIEPASICEERAATRGSCQGCCEMVGGSAPMQRLYGQIDAVARTRGTVLIVGETGTGKELVARAIHRRSGDREDSFVALNCSALPGDLVESELFGYVHGAFSGANKDTPGLFRAAQGGTLFLDEITEMNPRAQARLLRTLQERCVRPLGSTSEVGVDVRVIASTNRDPREAVESGHLREDLYYRLQAAVVEVPPLRERLDDLELLVAHFVAVFNAKLGRCTPIEGVTDRVMRAMRCYQWPGNVRELSNAIEAALTFGHEATVTLDDLPPAVAGRTPDEIALEQRVESLAEAERGLIRRTLDTTDGNLSAAARLLGISRKRLYARIAKYGLSYIPLADQ